MSDATRDLAAFARMVEALEPYLADLVFVGGWAHFLYTLRPEAAPIAFTPLTTQDVDVAAPLRLAPREQSIAQCLIAEGFEQRLSGDHVPPVSDYALGDEETGFYVEFLAPLEGGEVKRGGRQDATTRVGGVTAQKLRHLEILLSAPWQVSISREAGFPVSRPTAIRIPNPAAYIVQKVLVLRKRKPNKLAKDVLYLHDTFAVFSDSLPRVKACWDALHREMHPNHVRSFEKLSRDLVAEVTDLIRGAALIATGRPRPPTPEILLAGLRRGFAAAFDVQ